MQYYLIVEMRLIFVKSVISDEFRGKDYGKIWTYDIHLIRTSYFHNMWLDVAVEGLLDEEEEDPLDVLLDHADVQEQEEL